MPASEQRKQNMRHDIMNCVKANKLTVTADLWFTLIFRTEAELVKMCQELHIKV